MLSTISTGDDDSFPDFPGNFFPPQKSREGTDSFLSAATSGDALAVGINYLQQNASTYGVTAADLGHAAVTNRYSDSASMGGLTHVYLQQSYNGLPVLDATASVNLTPDNRIVTAAANFVGGLSYPATNTPLEPMVTQADAIATLASQAGLPTDSTLHTAAPSNGRNQRTIFTDADISSDPIVAQLVYVPNPDGGVDLAWQINLHVPGGQHWYDAAVAADGPRAGEVVRVADWVSDLASYNVLPRPVQDPLFGNLTTVTAPEDSLASPFGWHDINFIPGADLFTTSGNNVDAAPDPRTGVAAPNGGPTLAFAFPFNPAAAPIQNINAATTNLFYWANLAHDVAYHYGFDEAAGNFQLTNRVNQGLANDPVHAVAQSQNPNAFFNAFMATPPDGQSPDLEMGPFPTALGVRDSDFDGTVITHEFTHGISNRLTGGPANANALQNLQSRGMGEGWSDWFALVNTMKPGDLAATPRATGQWILGQAINGPGIRRFPYSFDLSIDPLTFGRFNGDVFPGQNNSEFHNAGEIWTSALWDMTWLMINKYGFSNDLYNGTGGQNVAMKVVFEAMKLQPTNPSFLQARNAILAADLAVNGGDDYELIWQAFARRGLGLSAGTVNSNALVIGTGFDVPNPAGRVQGTVYNDLNNNLSRDANDPVLPGFIVYNDSNNNGQLDASESRTTTKPDGSYSLAFLTPQVVHIRQQLTNVWRQVAPENNGARVVAIVRGQTITGQDFGDQGVPGQITGTLWNDRNADGLRTADESPLQKITVWVDLNNDGKLSILEPSGLTDFLGNYTIKNVPPGSGYTIRVSALPGMSETFPDPLLVNGGARVGVTVPAGGTVSGMDFAFTTAVDYGDAPDSYGTTLARNGARHGILPGFHLGALEDIEDDGQPSADALGDDTHPTPPDPLPDPPPPSPDDEDGVQFVGGLTPGFFGTVQVTVSTGGFAPGRLQGWIDFNHNGVFDASERIIANQTLGDGVHSVSFLVPANAQIGPTYARFRYGYEGDLGPTGRSIAGEVEDYTVSVLSNIPVAAPDVFPGPGQPLIKQGTTNNVLDVLANDPRTTFGPPSIVPGSFPATLPSGSTLRLNPTGDKILYSPAIDVLGTESFTYQVTDGHSTSAPGRVTINVSVRDPKALDDTVTLAPGTTTPTTIDALANDFFPFPIPDTHIISVQPVSVGASGLSIINGGTALSFTPPPGFVGTQIFQYTIDDNNATTNPSTATVTIQIADPANPAAAGYQAAMSVSIVDAQSGLPISSVNVGDQFLVVVTSQDLRPGGTTANRGVEGAYLDLLFNRNLVEPVPSTTNPRGFEIEYNPLYNLLQSGRANIPAPGAIDEVGATHQTGIEQQTGSNPPLVRLQGVGPGEIQVFSVLMQAVGSTPAGQPMQIFGDPADTPEGDVFIMPNNPDSFVNPNDPSFSGSPIVLPDEKVFLKTSAPLTIAGSGEGEFANTLNPYDVNQDTSVSPLDALLIINSLNAGIGGTLSTKMYSYTGALISLAGLVDVNKDSVLSPIDALMVVNYLNSNSLGAGEGEASPAPAIASDAAEGEGASASLGSGLDGDLQVLTTIGSASDSPPATAPTASQSVLLLAPAAGDEIDASPAAQTSTAATTASSSTKIDASAADELFALLATSSDDKRKVTSIQ